MPTLCQCPAYSSPTHATDLLNELKLLLLHRGVKKSQVAALHCLHEGEVLVQMVLLHELPAGEGASQELDLQCEGRESGCLVPAEFSTVL